LPTPTDAAGPIHAAFRQPARGPAKNHTSKENNMSRRKVLATLAAGLALAGSLTACGNSASAHTSAGSANLPTVKLMVGGIDKQIYLPYQLAQNLGFYKKYGVNVELSTEQSGGVGAEDAVASGQVDMAGAWYVHTIDFQTHGKDVIDIVQLSGAPGERIMCKNGSNIHSPADWKGKSIGVTDLGSGTDDLTLYLAARYQIPTTQFHRVGVGAGQTAIAALQHGTAQCVMTTQPTVNAIEKQNIGYSAIDLATTAGVQQWLGGFQPTAGVLANADWVTSHKATAQKVVTALVATMRWISTHTAADIANNLPSGFVSNGLTTKNDYITALDQDKTQFLPDGMMPANGPATVLAVEQLAGKVTKSVDLTKTYTNDYAIQANKDLGFPLSG
jgi:NitT/TauT family transport system substrate-binding protein